MPQYDDILREIGECSIFQALVLLGMSFVKFFAAFQTVSVVFTAGKVDFWCADSIWNASSPSPVAEACNSSCSNWSFSSEGQFESSWRSEFNLVCGREKLVNFCSTLYMVGLLVGSTVYGMISDRFGRVPAACGAVVNTWLASLALAFSPSIEVYASLRFLDGLGVSGILCVCNAFIAETVTSRYRLLFVLLGTNGWHVAMCLLGIIAYFIRSHWKLELALSAPAIAGVGVVLLIGESARWQLAGNHQQAAAATCRRIARINRRRVPATLDGDIKEVANTLIAQQGARPHPTIVDLLRSNMLRPTLLIWNNFFSVSMVYYGLIFSTGKLKGSIYMNFFVGSAVSIPAVFCAMAASRYIGRPVLFCVTYLLSGISMLIIAFTWNAEGMELFVIVMAIVGRFFATACFESCWAVSGEMFPTLVRNTGMGSSSTAARLGGILAPMVNMLGEFWPPLPFLIFAAVSLMASAMSLLLPETRGVRLPESLEDADKEYVRPKLMNWIGD